MAHECEGCGQVCYCDCDDMMQSTPPLGCRCQRAHDREAEAEWSDDDVDES